MTPEGLLTVIGIALAVYALLPPERQLDLRTRLSIVDWAVIISALLLVHYILFLPVLQAIRLAPSSWTWPFGFTGETASYLILAAATVLVAVRITMGRLGRARIPQFSELIERLLQQRRFADVAFLLERHLRVLAKASKGRYLLPRLKRHLDPPPWLAFLEVQEGTSTRRWYHGRVAKAIARLLPDHAAASDAATDVLRRPLVYQPFIRELATMRPYLGIDILRSGVDVYSDFQTLWLDALLDDAHSVLHYEIHNNQTLAGGHRYKFNPSNRILSFYFSNPTNAEEFNVYKPLGDHLLSDLRKRLRTPETDRYNQPLDEFYELERWRDPIHAVLRMFDFMIPEATHHGITWHMWLFYLPSFVDAFDRNLHPAPQVDLSREWPTPYHFFIYESISSLRDWFLEVEELASDNPNRGIDNAKLQVDGANIIKSAALAIGQTCRTVFASSRLTPHFKAYILEVCLRVTERLTAGGPFALHRQLLLASIANGGAGYVPDMAAHHMNVDEVVQNIDHFMRFKVGEELLSLRAP